MMGFLLTLLLVQDQAYAAGFQTSRDLELQHARILEEMSTDRAARSLHFEKEAMSIEQIIGVQQDIQESQNAIRPILESLVTEMRRLNETLVVANSAMTSQIQFAQTVLDIFVKALGGLLGIGWAASKTAAGRKFFNGRKRNSE